MIDTIHAPIDKWGLTYVDDVLGADDVHVWRASLDQPVNVIAKLAPLLSQDEYKRAERFHRPTDRRPDFVRDWAPRIIFMKDVTTEAESDYL